MAINEKLAKALNDQATMELQASVVYDQLAIDMEALDLCGIAGWFRAQAEEERMHCSKFVAHLLDRGGHPIFGQIEAIAAPVDTVLAAFEASLAHEKKVSNSIRDLYRLAMEQGEIDSLPLLQFFVEEQVEEEATVSTIIGRVKMIGDSGAGLLALDQELGARTSATVAK